MAEFARTIIAMVRAGEELTARQIAVLLHCHQERETEQHRYVKAIAQSLNLNKPSISRATDKLIALDGGGSKKALLVRTTPESDRRQCIVSLTKPGASYVAKMLRGFENGQT